MPSEEQWQELQSILDEDVLFVWESAPDPSIAEKLRAMDVDSVVIDPGGNIGDEDWLATQRANLERLERL